MKKNATTRLKKKKNSEKVHFSLFSTINIEMVQSAIQLLEQIKSSQSPN